jgi:hypothetical protein
MRSTATKKLLDDASMEGMTLRAPPSTDLRIMGFPWRLYITRDICPTKSRAAMASTTNEDLDDEAERDD